MKMSATYDSLVPNLPPGYDGPIPSNPNPKHDIYVYHEGNCGSYFTAHSVEDDGTISKYDKIYTPSRIAKKHCYNASCNGLFYFEDCSDKDRDCLWNPTTNEVTMMSKSRTKEIEILPNDELLEPSFRVQHIPQGCVMWCDNASQDCYVVKLILVRVVDDEQVVNYKHDDDEEEEEEEEVYCDWHLDLYSLKTDSWKRIQTMSHGFHQLGVCINGFYFCPAYDGLSHDYILSIDLSTQALCHVPLPLGIGFDPNYRVADYNGLLSIIVSPFPGGLPMYEYPIWVLNDGMWKREFVFEANQYLYPEKHLKIGELWYFSNEHDEVMVIHQVTGKWKCLPVLDDMVYFPFVESNVRLNTLVDQEEDEEEEEEGGTIGAS